MVQPITTLNNLKESIEILRSKKKFEEKELKEQLSITLEALKPSNLIKSTVKELSSTPEFKGSLVDASLSIGAGYLSKRIAIGNSHNPFKQVLGTLLQFAVTKLISGNSKEIKTVLSGLLGKVLTKESNN